MKIKRWLSALFILLVVISGLGFIKFSQIQAAIAFAESFPEPSASVKSSHTKTIQHIKKSKVIGQVQATQTLVISNEYPGVITFVGFNPGDIVTKNQVLLRIDSSVEQANLTAATARLKLANKTFERLVKLVKQQRISQDEVDKAEAEVSIAQSEVNNLTLIIDKKVIHAPFAGQVDLSQFQVGQLLDANTQITSLIGIDETIWVDFSIPQTLPQLAIGDQVEISLVTTKKQEHLTIANVIAKPPSLDVNSRQQRYRAALKNTNNVLIHNQIVNVYIPIANSEVVMVPTNAIMRNHFGDYVYQLVKDEQENWRAKSIKVTLGEKVDDMQVVLAGLSNKKFIATEGAFKLKEDMLVYTKQPDQTTSVVGGK